MKQIWTNEAWEDYNYWHANSKRVTVIINQLLQRIEHNYFKGSVQPQPLGYHLDEWWTLHIIGHHRLVYKVHNQTITIVQCKLHANRR